MAKYIQDMTMGEITEMLASYIKHVKETDNVELKTIAIGNDMHEVNIREEDGLEYQQVMVTAEIDGEDVLVGVEWIPELGGLSRCMVAPAKKNVLHMSDEEAQLLKQVLHAAYKTWRPYPGLPYGHSEIHSMYPEHIDLIIKMHDAL